MMTFAVCDLDLCTIDEGNGMKKHQTRFKNQTSVRLLPTPYEYNTLYVM